jgi:hypothetical protein
MGINGLQFFPQLIDHVYKTKKIKKMKINRKHPSFLSLFDRSKAKKEEAEKTLVRKCTLYPPHIKTGAHQ